VKRHARHDAIDATSLVDCMRCSVGSGKKRLRTTYEIDQEYYSINA